MRESMSELVFAGGGREGRSKGDRERVRVTECLCDIIIVISSRATTF